ncbi:hypothetical protein BGZ80_006582, partial [Entomortierella chlamydospora]
MDISVQGYVAFRLKESPNPLTASMLHQEWQKWISILKQSGLGPWENAANQASTPSKKIINGWLNKPNKKCRADTKPYSRVLRSSSSSSKARHLDIENVSCDLPSGDLLPPDSTLTNKLLGSSPSVISSLSRSSSSLNSNAVLSPGALRRMINTFSCNFNDYKGKAWILPTGTIFDDVVYEYTLTLAKESSLHSFILDHTSAIIKLFEDSNGDKSLVERRLAEHDTVHEIPLSDFERTEIERYLLPSDEFWNLLSHGWTRTGNTESTTDVFCFILHCSLTNISKTFLTNNYRLPEVRHESWYTWNIRGFIEDLFNMG